jgi:hypothetical protein
MKRVVALLAVACSVSPAIAQRVRVDYDHGASFSRYKTYSWAQLSEPQSPVGQFPNQLMHDRIVRFVEEALAAKGLKRVEKGGNLQVGYQMDVTEQLQYNTVGSGWGWDGGFSTTTTQTILTGTLIINMMDSREKQLIFQGISTETISSRPERNTRRLQKAVNKIFEKYPPRL